MNTLTGGLTLSLGILAGAAQAQQMLTINGTEYLMSDLMATCQGMTDNPDGQIACFGNVARLLEEQTGQQPQTELSVTQALDALRSAAEYRDAGSGLTITGSDCFVQVLYYNNYFHISRRNISTVDVFSAKFDASNIDIDQVSLNRRGQEPLSTGVLDSGSVAVVQGGMALESAQNGFASRSPGTALQVYASEVIDQLPSRESGSFDFVLVHPQHSDTSDQIWSAFEDFVSACRG